MTGGIFTFSSTSAVTMLFRLTTTWHWYLHKQQQYNSSHQRTVA
jgi:hypothetical protein